MALKALMLKKDLDAKRHEMAQLETRGADIEAREANIMAAICELTDESSQEQRDAVSAEVDKIEAEKKEHETVVSQLREEIEHLEKELEAAESEQNVPDDNRPEERTSKMENIITRNSKEYIDAYAEYIKGKKDASELRNMLTTENDSTPSGTATVPVPELVYDVVKTAWEKDGIMALVKKSYLRGNLKVGFEISATAASIHAEGAAAISAEDLVLGIVELVPASIKKFVQVSDEALDMGGEAFLRYIYDELTYRIAKKAADELVAKIIAAPQTSTTTAPKVGKITSTTVTLGLIASAMAQLSDEAANPVIIMNKATWGEFKKAQAAGNYGYDPFEGLPIVFNNSMTAFTAATTGVAYAIVGDLGQGALANFPNGDELEIKVDRLSLKKQDLVEILGRKFIALGVVAPDAFVKICH